MNDCTHPRKQHIDRGWCWCPDCSRRFHPDMMTDEERNRVFPAGAFSGHAYAAGMLAAIAVVIGITALILAAILH